MPSLILSYVFPLYLSITLNCLETFWVRQIKKLEDNNHRFASFQNARTEAWNSTNNKFPLRKHWLLLMPRDPDYPAYTVFAKGLIPHIICPLSLNPTHSLFLSLPPFLSPSLPSPSPNHPDIKFYICTFNRLGWARDQSILVEFIATCRLNYSMEHTGKKT